ncbi:cell division protein BlhA [Acinetobacter sp. TSRC1-2]|uniref:cell division protein BlhA n=1 Tax=unclassified Acinetobacter TaxID=196816 RepID=UPI003CE738D4
MALNVGQDFKQRWLDVPEAVRQAFIDDLHRVCNVLKPETNIQKWLEKDKEAQQHSFERIERAYVERKAQLIEEARIRKQLALEKSLENKRAEQAAYAHALQLDEARQFAEQTQTLAFIRQTLEHETHVYTARYHKNPEGSALNFSKGMRSIPDTAMLSELESVRLRLELEAETLIEQAVTVFRAKLHQASQDEIDYILKRSNLSDEPPKS